LSDIRHVSRKGSHCPSALSSREATDNREIP
jgi:hypothetical protein